MEIETNDGSTPFLIPFENPLVRETNFFSHLLESFSHQEVIRFKVSLSSRSFQILIDSYAYGEIEFEEEIYDQLLQFAYDYENEKLLKKLIRKFDLVFEELISSHKTDLPQIKERFEKILSRLKLGKTDHYDFYLHLASYHLIPTKYLEDNSFIQEWKVKQEIVKGHKLFDRFYSDLPRFLTTDKEFNRIWVKKNNWNVITTWTRGEVRKFFLEGYPSLQPKIKEMIIYFLDSNQDEFLSLDLTFLPMISEENKLDNLYNCLLHTERPYARDNYLAIKGFFLPLSKLKWLEIGEDYLFPGPKMIRIDEYCLLQLGQADRLSHREHPLNHLTIQSFILHHQGMSEKFRKKSLSCMIPLSFLRNEEKIDRWKHLPLRVSRREDPNKNKEMMKSFSFDYNLTFSRILTKEGKIKYIISSSKLGVIYFSPSEDKVTDYLEKGIEFQVSSYSFRNRNQNRNQDSEYNLVLTRFKYQDLDLTLDWEGEIERLVLGKEEIRFLDQKPVYHSSYPFLSSDQRMIVEYGVEPKIFLSRTGQDSGEMDEIVPVLKEDLKEFLLVSSNQKEKLKLTYGPSNQKRKEEYRHEERHFRRLISWFPGNGQLESVRAWVQKEWIPDSSHGELLIYEEIVHHNRITDELYQRYSERILGEQIEELDILHPLPSGLWKYHLPRESIV